MPHAPRASKKELEWLKKLRLALGLHRLNLARERGRPLQPILESVPGQEPEEVRPCAARRMRPSLWRRGSANAASSPRLLLELIPPPFLLSSISGRDAAAAETPERRG